MFFTDQSRVNLGPPLLRALTNGYYYCYDSEEDK